MSKKVIVSVNEGKVRGIKHSSTFSKKEYYSFFGVPYAEQPIGNLRFKDPVKVKPWKNVHDASKEKPGCAQFSWIEFDFYGTESCLFNNIHSPQLPQKNEPLRPVIVNIHPGAFHQGSPNSYHYGSPDFVMHNDVVYVCIGYRLHILGFLNLGLKDCSGNQALKDIIMSLEWIRDNISSFGGDSENITLLGASSGSALIQALMLSPAAKGLFHKAVLMSGYLMNPVAPFEDTNKHHAIEVAKLLGYKEDIENLEKILRYLKKQPFTLLHQKQSNYQNKAQNNVAPITTIGVFGPTIDPRILPCQPIKLIKSMMRIPLMTGISEYEAVIGFSRDYRNKTEQNFMTTFCQNHWGWGYDLTEDEIQIIQKQIELFYLEGKPVSEAPLSVKVEIQSDITISDLYETLIDAIAAELPSSVFVFVFEFLGSMVSMREVFRDDDIKKDLKGTFHGTEFCYWNRFKNPGDKETHRMVNNFTKLVTTFARNGDPNHDELEPHWRSTSPRNPCYLSINTVMKLVKGKLNNNRLQFWDDLKKQLKRDINSRQRK